MRFRIFNILRTMLGVLLVVTATLKLYSLNSFAHTVQMFTDAYFLTLNHPAVYVLSLCLCLYEILLGVTALFSRFRFTSMSLMIVTFAGFTCITFVNLFFPTSLGPIQDCKCFGNFLQLSPSASFVKSCILFAFSIVATLLASKRCSATDLTRVVCVIGIVGISLPLAAQETVKLKGKVRIGVRAEDSFTHIGLPAFITLYDSDSIVIDTTTCKKYKLNSFATFYIPRKTGEYTIRVEYPGYRTSVKKQYFDFSEDLLGWGFGNVSLKRLPSAIDSLKSVGLDEVVVRGTRLQVAYRGDTIVYDAQAFNIPEGAMLDALVRQLPGAELKVNGDVYINGKKLDYITLNGNDFFKGNNKVILENLPYFTVKNLLVYYKDPPFSLIKPTMDEGKDYVLDVVMKREYSIGSIVNVEVGIGTDKRWKGKAFELRYDDYTRLSMFTNLNNLNENQTPGTDGDWSPKKQSRGLQTTKQAGVNLNVNNAKKTFSLDQSTLIEWSDKNTVMQRHSETFSKEGSILGGTLSVNDLNDFTLTNNTKIDLILGKFLFGTNHNIIYTDQDATSMSADSTYRSNIINTDHRQTLSANRHMYGNGHFSIQTNLWDEVNTTSLFVNYSFSSFMKDQTSTLRNIHYFNTGQTDGRNDYRDNTSHSYSYSIKLDQDLRLSQRVRLMYELAYNQRGSGSDHDYYCLYDYGGRYESELILPSTADSLITAMDYANSHNYFTLGRGISNTLHFGYSWKNISVSASMKYTYMHDRIHYQNNLLDTVSARSYGAWNPNISLQRKWKKNILRLKYSAYNSRPAFDRLMPLANSTNTLYVRINNPNLRSQLRNTLSAELDMRPGGIKPTWWLKYELITMSRAWGNRISYNTNTGAYTSIADNVDGNWNTTMSFGMNGLLDKQKKWRYNISAKIGYTHSVDYDIAYDGAHNALSRVNTLKPITTWKLTYRNDVFSAGATAGYSGNYSHEKEYGERDMSIHEYKFGINTQYTIPLAKITVATDLNLYSQNGYDSDVMNSDDWIWNASMSRAFLKGRLVAKVEMYDILHQLSARSYSVNAQSRIETHYNSIPHYILFSLGYKLAKTPKKH